MEFNTRFGKLSIIFNIIFNLTIKLNWNFDGGFRSALFYDGLAFHDDGR